MRLGVFAYNFEHKKTQEGLLELFLNGYTPTCVIAANPVKLSFYQSKIRISPKGIQYTHPKNISEKLGVPYHVVDHDSRECAELIKDLELDLGIVLGARIIKEHVIDAFKTGILNMHPGLLPENRGLDNVKWAILDGIQQGVTTHLIDKWVDRGFMIDKKTIEVYEDDSLVDICFRLQNLEIKMMVEAIPKIEAREISSGRIGEGKRNHSVPRTIEKHLMTIFEDYKKEYPRQLRDDL